MQHHGALAWQRRVFTGQSLGSTCRCRSGTWPVRTLHQEPARSVAARTEPPAATCARAAPYELHCTTTTSTTSSNGSKGARHRRGRASRTAVSAFNPPSTGPSASTSQQPAAAALATTSNNSSGSSNGRSNGPLALTVRGLSFHPPGAPSPLLQDINMQVPRNSLGLIIGRSGSGKTTLLQVLAGLCEQTSGSVHIHPTGPTSPLTRLTPPASNQQRQAAAAAAATAGPKQGSKFASRMAAENRAPRPASSSAPAGSSSSSASALAAPGSGGGSGSGLLLPQAPLPPPASMDQRMARVGLVFQFPERHFLGSDVFSELTFTWPRDPAAFLQQQALRARVLQVLQAVRLADVDMSQAPWSLSGGQQRRLALAIQLIRQPSVLLLDEPLAGLDWQARLEVVDLLQQLKQQCSLLVVSHDLREVSPLVDCAWTMKTGGLMEAVPSWPPPGGVEALTLPPGSRASASLQPW